MQVRGLTEWTANTTHLALDQASVADGIGGISVGSDSISSYGIVNVRQKYIHGISKISGATNVNFSSGKQFGKKTWG